MVVLNFNFCPTSSSAQRDAGIKVIVSKLFAILHEQFEKEVIFMMKPSKTLHIYVIHITRDKHFFQYVWFCHSTLTLNISTVCLHQCEVKASDQQNRI